MLSRLRFWQNLNVEPWTPPARTSSSIRIRKRERKAGYRTVALGVRGNSTSVVVDPNDGYAKALGSNIEHNAFMTFCADRMVRNIVCQAPPFQWFDEDGVVHTHTFDFLLELVDGKRVAVMVKNATKARMDNLELFADRLASQMPLDFANDVTLMTDEDLPAWLVANARLIHSSRLDEAPGFNADSAECKALVVGVDADVLERAQEFDEPVTIEHLLEPIGDEGFRAVARLIFAGHLQQAEPQTRISWTSLVEKVAAR